MAKTSRTTTRGANLPVPQTKEAAAAALARVGELNRELARREADLGDALARIKGEVEAAAEPLRVELAATTEGLRIWSEANRADLTGGGKIKSADLGTGLIGWRLRPPRVSVPRDIAGLVERLRSLGLQRFVRTKEEIDREAMLAEPDVARAVPGIKIGSEGEDFYVEPFAAELSEVRS